jgi:ketosteroid isomerase-like protein
VSNVEIVNAYFTAMRSKDAAAHRELFADDAELVTSLGIFVGVEAIAGFYRDFAFSVDDLWPEPGPLLVSGECIAVELRARANGTVSLMADFFTIRDGKIVRLAIYTGPPNRRGASA